MAFPKKEHFSPEDQLISNYARALCHPARVNILKQLQTRGGMYVHEIEHSIPLSKGAVSDHLRMLREIQFVNVKCQGRHNYYSLNLSVLAEADLTFNTMFSGLYGMSSGRKTLPGLVASLARI